MSFWAAVDHVHVEPECDPILRCRVWREGRASVVNELARNHLGVAELSSYGGVRLDEEEQPEYEPRPTNSQARSEIPCGDAHEAPDILASASWLRGQCLTRLRPGQLCPGALTPHLGIWRGCPEGSTPLAPRPQAPRTSARARVRSKARKRQVRHLLNAGAR
jgi:hypothetical protein